MARGKRRGVETKKKILSPCVVGTRRSKTDRSMERSVFLSGKFPARRGESPAIHYLYTVISVPAGKTNEP